jgi:hypothetical protein
VRSRFEILRQANLNYDEWARCDKRDAVTALEALELYREFHGKATDPDTRASCAAFDASMNVKGTTAPQRAQLVETAAFATRYVTQTLFDFIHLVQATTKGPA